MVRGRPKDAADAEYLSANFDATKLTKPQLRSVLSAHGVTDLPPVSARKETLVELFTRHITERGEAIARDKANVRPSDKGIAFLDEQSQPSPRHGSSPSQRLAGKSPRKSSPSSSPSRRRAGRGSGLDDSIVRPTRRTVEGPSSPASRSRTPTPHSRSRSTTPKIESPIAMLQRTVPRYSDTPQSATIKLHDRLEFIASANRFTKAKHVICNTPSKPPSPPGIQTKPNYLRAALGWSGRATVSLVEGLVPLVKAISIGLFVLCLGFYIRWKYFYPFPYCDSGASKGRAMGRVAWRLVDLPDVVNTFCINCPIYGVCKNGSMLCQEGFLPHRNWVLWGSDCVPDRRKMSLVDDLVGKIRFLLAERAGQVLCSGTSERLESVMGEPQLSALLQQTYPLAEWNTVQFEALYKMALQTLATNPSLLGVQVAKNPLDGSLILHSLSPRITIGCRVRVYLRHFYERNQLRIWLTGLAILLAAFLYLTYQRRSTTSKRTEELCQAVLQILAEQDALNRRDPTIPSAISVHQIRDALFFKANHRTRNRLWPLVCRAIGRNSNVRETVMSIKGEEHRVWEWIGSDVLSPYLNLIRNFKRMHGELLSYGQLVCEKYDQCGFKLHRPGEWTVLAGIIQVDEETKVNKVVSLGTGLKCLPLSAYSKGQLGHQLVRDMHAEVLARRGLVAYLCQELQQARDDSSLVIEKRSEDGLFGVRTGVRFVMYISQAPCGDASMHLLPPRDVEGVVEGPVKRAKVLRGRSQVAHRGLRTKPGRADAPPCASLSCTDKIALWSCLGWQGAALRTALHSPVRVEEFIIGERFSLEQCETTISHRVSSVNASIVLKFHGIKDDLFKYSRTCILNSSAAGDEFKLIPASVAQVWYEGGVAETLVEGRKLGAAKPKNGLLPLKSRSSLCTQALIKGDVRRAKQANQYYQRRKAELFLGGEGVFVGWTVSDPIMSDHRANLFHGQGQLFAQDVADNLSA